MEAAAMTAGPVRNLTAMANVATEFPHAMIFGCKAINRPFITKKKKKKKLVATTNLINLNSTVFTPNYPYYYISWTITASISTNANRPRTAKRRRWRDPHVGWSDQFISQ